MYNIGLYWGWLCFFALIALFYLIVSALRRHVHMLQQHGYQTDHFLEWHRQRGGAEIRKAELLLLIPCILLVFRLYLAASICELVFFAILLIAYWPRPKKDKKPLVFTKRAKRLYLTGCLLMFLAVAVFTLIAGFTRQPLVLFAGIFVTCFFAYALGCAAAKIMEPVEKRVNDSFLRQAVNKLQSLPELTRIGVTGSYGKTSTKMIMAAVLAEKYDTLATPGSFNTPMGVTRVVNDDLSPIHQIFVCEMGAKGRGEIKELCDIAHPTIGVLTAIGEQHLESFGSVQAIIDTKFELLESLPADGLAVVNGDEPRITDNLSRCPCRVVRYGIGRDNDYRAEDIVYGPRGTRFTYVHGDVREEMTTPLLGRHMVINILGALAVGDQLGVPLAKMRRAVRHLAQIEHRLQLINAGSYYIIDDAFNSNPAGAAAALEVLASFDSGKRIIITPGMVELGEKEYELNFELGRQLTEACDYIILVGKKHSMPLQEGVAAAGWPEENLYVASDLADARARLNQIVAAGDVVLFENDLPDTYNE